MVYNLLNDHADIYYSSSKQNMDSLFGLSKATVKVRGKCNLINMLCVKQSSLQYNTIP